MIMLMINFLLLLEKVLTKVVFFLIETWTTVSCSSLGIYCFHPMNIRPVVELYDILTWTLFVVDSLCQRGKMRPYGQNDLNSGTVSK